MSAGVAGGGGVAGVEGEVDEAQGGVFDELAGVGVVLAVVGPVEVGVVERDAFDEGKAAGKELDRVIPIANGARPPPSR